MASRTSSCAPAPLTALLLALTLALALAPRACSAAGLADAPLAADALQPLDFAPAWTFSVDGNATRLAASVPGDLITDMQRAGLVGDPLFERNFKSLAWDAPATFRLVFDADAAVLAQPARWLVLDSVKMGAYVSLNGAFLGAARDQFLRYEFDVSAVLRAAANELLVTFPPSSDRINDEARWIACSGAWDWAPYTATYNSAGAHTMSKGIARSVYLAGVGAAAVEHLQPRIFYSGAYPTASLSDAVAGPWEVAARVHLRAPAGGASGTLAVAGSWGGANSSKVTLIAGNQTVELRMEVPAGAVRLWWPNGAGAQVLYNLTATFTPSAAAGGAGGATLSVTRSVGFRFFALVTGNDTDPSTLSGVDGSGAFTMRYNVNGMKVFARGANLIPMDEMEGRLSVAAHSAMLQSAAAAGMNTLRVWGGGSFFPDVVYDTCDELGILLYHGESLPQTRHRPARARGCSRA